jgi:predicted small metal-binding protein
MKIIIIMMRHECMWETVWGCQWEAVGRKEREVRSKLFGSIRHIYL